MHELLLYKVTYLDRTGHAVNRDIAILALIFVNNVRSRHVPQCKSDPGLLGPFPRPHPHYQPTGKHQQTNVQNPQPEPVQNPHNKQYDGNHPDNRNAPHSGNQIVARRKGTGNTAGRPPGVYAADGPAGSQPSLKGHLVPEL